MSNKNEPFKQVTAYTDETPTYASNTSALSNTNEKAQSAEEVHTLATKSCLHVTDRSERHHRIKGFIIGYESAQSRISQLETDLSKSQEKCKAYQEALGAVKTYLSTKTVEGFEAYTIVEQALKPKKDESNM